MIKIVNKRNDELITTIALKDLNLVKNDLIEINDKTYLVSNKKIKLTSEGCSEDYSKLTEDVIIYVTHYSSLH